MGGTSARCAQWAALIAIADQGRLLAGLGSLSGASQVLPVLYANSGDFNDIVSGSASGSGKTNYAGPGYDLVTGLGTPKAAALVQALVGGSTGSVGAATAPPSQQSPIFTVSQSIGSPSPAGASSFSSNGVYTLNGSGSDISLLSDQFQFDYTTLSGDGTVIARVASVANVNQWTKAGLMMRDALTAGSDNAFIGITPGNEAAFQIRQYANIGTLSSTTPITGSAPTGSNSCAAATTSAAYVSSNGMSWMQLGATTYIPMNTTIYVGLAVTSHLPGILAAATFDNVSLSAAAATALLAAPAISSVTPVAAVSILSPKIGITQGPMLSDGLVGLNLSTAAEYAPFNSAGDSSQQASSPTAVADAGRHPFTAWLGDEFSGGSLTIDASSAAVVRSMQMVSTGRVFAAGVRREYLPRR